MHTEDRARRKQLHFWKELKIVCLHKISCCEIRKTDITGLLGSSRSVRWCKKTENWKQTEIELLCTEPSKRTKTKTKPKPTLTCKTCSGVCISLCTTDVQNTAWNSSDNLPSYLPGNHHCSLISNGGEGCHRQSAKPVITLQKCCDVSIFIQTYNFKQPIMLRIGDQQNSTNQPIAASSHLHLLPHGHRTETMKEEFCIHPMELQTGVAHCLATAC